MKILLAGDLHFNKSHFQWLDEQKGKYDCLCLTGDFLDNNSGQYAEQTEWVSQWLEKTNKQIFICSGNHDLDDFAECDWLSSIKNEKVCSDNQTRTLSGINFGCLPYIAAFYEDFIDCDILLNHVPPKNTETAQERTSGSIRDWGDEDLYKALEEGVISPRYLLCGHVENTISKREKLHDTEIINPGADHHASVPNHEIIVVMP